MIEQMCNKMKLNLAQGCFLNEQCPGTDEISIRKHDGFASKLETRSIRNEIRQKGAQHHSKLMQILCISSNPVCQ